MDDVAALGYHLLAKFRNSRGQKNLILQTLHNIAIRSTCHRLRRLKNQISSHSRKDPETHNIGIMSNTFYAWTCAEESLRILVEWAQDGEPKHQTAIWNLNSFTKWNLTYRFSAFFLLGVVAWNEGLIPEFCENSESLDFLRHSHLATWLPVEGVGLWISMIWCAGAGPRQQLLGRAQRRQPKSSSAIETVRKLTWPVFCDYAECILPNDMCDYVGI